MISVDQFKAKLPQGDPYALVDEVLLVDDAVHVTSADRGYIRESLANTFQISIENIYLRIVGSAKLGFSISEIKDRDTDVITGVRYRSFNADSDIDVAIVSSGIYELIWRDLSRYAHRLPYFPWNSEKLGDYMVCGWLRPDYFPKDARLRWCDDWWKLFNKHTIDPRFQRRRVRGALFHSTDQMRLYYARGMADCIKAAQTPSL